MQKQKQKQKRTTVDLSLGTCIGIPTVEKLKERARKPGNGSAAIELHRCYGKWEIEPA